MCLLVLAWKVHPKYRLIVAANRDEYHDRPAAPLGRWEEPDILAGRDLRAGGTWLAVDRRRRLGIVTNFRDFQRPRANLPSRGELIPSYLSQPADAETFARSLASNAPEYSGFNLLIADADSLWYVSNRTEVASRALSPGVHGLSNHTLDTPWPKLLRVRERFAEWLREPMSTSGAAADALFTMLGDREPAPSDTSIPPGLAPELARALSAPFVHNPVFGTRCSTVLMLEPSDAMHIAERRFSPEGTLSGETAFSLAPNEWP